MNALTREQLEDRLAALHRASLELVSDTSLETLLRRIATVACEQAGARYCAVSVVNDKNELEQFIPIGMTDKEIARIDRWPRGLGLLGALIRSKEPIRITDLNRDPRRVGFPAYHPEMTSFLGVPIRLADRSLGQIYLTNKINEPAFTEEDERVIEMLAAYAGIAISNARLYKRLSDREQNLSRRNEVLGLLNELASILAGAINVDQTLDNVLTKVMEFLHLEAGEVYLREEEGKRLKLTLHRGDMVEHLWPRTEFLPGEGMIGSVALSGQMQVVSLPHEDINLEPKAMEQCFRQIASFPLTGTSGVLGVLCVANCHPQPMQELEIQFLTTISSWVGTVVENIRLNVDQRRLAVLEERERFGMDLHDGIIQSIYAVGLTLEHARLLINEAPDQAKGRIENAISDLNSTIRDLRAYILDLRPRHLHDENLMQGLKRLTTEFHNNTLVDINLQGPNDGVDKIPNTQALALFHICQEALANIAKHARARHVEVAVWITHDRILLEVSDDGRGFDPAKSKSALGHGLSNMQTRVRNAGGEVELSSEPNSGTTVLAWVPISNES